MTISSKVHDRDIQVLTRSNGNRGNGSKFSLSSKKITSNLKINIKSMHHSKLKTQPDNQNQIF